MRYGLFPVAVDDIGHDLERVEADADELYDVRHRKVCPENGIDILHQEPAVLKHADHADIEDQTDRHGGFSQRLLFPPGGKSAQIIDNNTEQEENNALRLPLCIKEQGEDQKHKIPAADT